MNKVNIPKYQVYAEYLRRKHDLHTDFLMDIDGLNQLLTLNRCNKPDEGERTDFNKSLNKISTYLSKARTECIEIARKNKSMHYSAKADVNLLDQLIESNSAAKNLLTLQNGEKGYIKTRVSEIFSKHGIKFIENPGTEAYKMIALLRKNNDFSEEFEIRLDK